MKRNKLRYALRTMGSKFTLNFSAVTIKNYEPDVRIKQTSFGTEEVVPTNRRTERDAWLCVVRKAYTGVPYSGACILNPDDMNTDGFVPSDDRAKLTAAKRAIFAMNIAMYGEKKGKACGRMAYNTFALENFQHVFDENDIEQMCRENTYIYHKLADESAKQKVK